MLLDCKTGISGGSVSLKWIAWSIVIAKPGLMHEGACCQQVMY
jgi:hypothetical protein